MNSFLSAPGTIKSCYPSYQHAGTHPSPQTCPRCPSNRSLLVQSKCLNFSSHKSIILTRKTSNNWFLPKGKILLLWGKCPPNWRLLSKKMLYVIVEATYKPSLFSCVYREHAFLLRRAEDLLGRTKLTDLKPNHHQGRDSKSHLRALYVAVYACDPRTQRQRQENYFKLKASLHSNFQASQACTERPCLQTTTNF